MNNKTKIIFGFLFLSIMIGLIFITKLFSERNRISDMGTSNLLLQTTRSSIGFGSYLLDTDDKMQIHTIFTEEDSFEGNFAAGGYFEETTNFNVILLKNFKQTEFSVENSNKSFIHKIEFEKSIQNRYDLFKYRISIKDLEYGINDFILIFTKEYTQDDLNYYREVGSTHMTTYTARFTIQRHTSNLENKKVKFDRNYKVLKGPSLPDCYIFNTESVEFSQYPSPITFLDRVTKSIVLPITINTSSLMEGPYFQEEYTKDEKAGEIEHLAVFSILNNKMVPVFYGDEKELVHFYEKKYADDIMIKPRIEFTEKGMNTFVTIVISYPYKKQEDYEGTYKITKWSSSIISHQVYINVTDIE